MLTLTNSQIIFYAAINKAFAKSCHSWSTQFLMDKSFTLRVTLQKLNELWKPFHLDFCSFQQLSNIFKKKNFIFLSLLTFLHKTKRICRSFSVIWGSHPRPLVSTSPLDAVSTVKKTKMPQSCRVTDENVPTFIKKTNMNQSNLEFLIMQLSSHLLYGFL